MMFTADGKQYVWGVFDADGYECKDLVALFDTEQLAEDAAREMREQEVRDGRIRTSGGISVELLCIFKELSEVARFWIGTLAK